VSDHLITPPPELVARWKDHWFDAKIKHINLEDYILTQAAQWGADQELESCIELLKADGYKALVRDLRAARRPKLPTLKEQALDALHAVATGANDICEQHQDLYTIRKALEALND
jgi:hypothetical protein